jgi:membrane associated rhomboid family serine protease
MDSPTVDFRRQQIPKIQPVFLIMSIILVAIFVAYRTGLFKTLPCGPGIVPAFERNFIHLDLSHLAANLGSFYVLSRIEAQNGSGNFAKTILTLLALSTAGEVIFKVGQGKNCAIGFSGILFGLIAWELINTSGRLNAQIIVSLLLAVLGTSLNNPKASLQGHALGAAAGVVAGIGTLVWKKTTSK